MGLNDNYLFRSITLAHARYLRNRSTARNFIKKQATASDIEEIKSLIRFRQAMLVSNDTSFE
ncbi:hypothetical protein EFS13_10030 [Lentilactobacillus buchneri]|nr:hypothetical protein [Lentilactobacillus buchneri]MCT2899171.1 hypothetical protein [Lentilactobacillus buchneri]MCT3252318.1 hypothetical protein [Lentilactobacillus buchneri]MCT3546907.1 hypothetical protein [Lentilactobacillus buchneri]MCT3555868.1 hypothetical protein [Lentilactobacillus buchneri]